MTLLPEFKFIKAAVVGVACNAASYFLIHSLLASLGFSRASLPALIACHMLCAQRSPDATACSDVQGK